jgi:hypothetical protein
MSTIDEPFDFTKALDQGDVKIAVGPRGERIRVFEGHELEEGWHLEGQPAPPKDDTEAKAQTQAKARASARAKPKDAA